jgi:prepilin-type N-terminal cleavage/methylation domain-containing protein
MMNPKGFSLMELLCALTIGFIVISMSITLYFHIKRRRDDL